MTNEHRSQFTNRRGILRLLTDKEVASVGRAEQETRLAEGEEYIDLGHIERGVCRASGTSTPTRLALPKKAVAEGTWQDILAELEARR